MTTSVVIVTPQIDGGARYLAVSAADADAVRRDPAMIDAVEVLACLDVLADGGRFWARPLGSRDSADGRATIRAFLGLRT